MSSLTPWRLVLKRTRSDWKLLSSIALGVLLATTPLFTPPKGTEIDEERTGYSHTSPPKREPQAYSNDHKATVGMQIVTIWFRHSAIIL